jgi:hypothetical protein
MQLLDGFGTVECLSRLSQSGPFSILLGTQWAPDRLVSLPDDTAGPQLGRATREGSHLFSKEITEALQFERLHHH